MEEADRRRLVSLTRRRRFAKGEVVFHEGDAGNALHLVETGHFAVRITTPLGDVATIRVHGPGGLFGELSVISPAPRSATVIAVTKGETLQLSEAAFAELRTASRGADEILTHALVAEVRRLSDALVEALYTPVNLRVVRRLGELAETFARGAEEIVIPLTQEDLANLAGTTRPTANRVVRGLEDDGIVAVSRGRIAVIDLEALRRRAR